MPTSQLEALTGLPMAGTAAMKCFYKWLSESITNIKDAIATNPDIVPKSILELLKVTPKYIPDEEPLYTVWSLPDIMAFRNMRHIPSDNINGGKFDLDKDIIVLFLDDVHLVNKTMQSYMFQLLTYRSINGHKLPDNVVLVMAGNRSNDKAGFQQMLAPITNRIYFLDVHANIDKWIKNFAAMYGVRTDIMMFLQHNDSCFIGTPMENQS